MPPKPSISMELRTSRIFPIEMERIVNMKRKGMSNNEIARHTGRDQSYIQEVWVRYVRDFAANMMSKEDIQTLKMEALINLQDLQADAMTVLEESHGKLRLEANMTVQNIIKEKGKMLGFDKVGVVHEEQRKDAINILTDYFRSRGDIVDVTEDGKVLLRREEVSVSESSSNQVPTVQVLPDKEGDTVDIKE